MADPRVKELLKNMPSTVKIGPYDIEVLKKRQWLEIDGNPMNWGAANLDHQMVVVANTEGMPNSKFLTGIVLHEFLHLIYAVFGLRPQGNITKEEEKTVTQLEYGLTAFLVDNPDWFNWIKDALHPEEQT